MRRDRGKKPRIRNKRSSLFVRSWKEVQGFLQSEAMSQKARGSGSDLEIWGWAKGDEFKAQLMNMTRVLGTHSNGARCMAWV